MSGMEIMLKSMGIDPDAIKNTIAIIAQTAKEMKEQNDRIEAALLRCETLLKSQNEQWSDMGESIKMPSPVESSGEQE